jgi:hypothetical protein
MSAMQQLRTLVVLAGVFELFTALGSLFGAAALKRWLRLQADFDPFYLQLTGSYQFTLATALLLGGLGLFELRSAARLAIVFHVSFAAFALAAAMGLFPITGSALTFMQGCLAYHTAMVVLTGRALIRCDFASVIGASSLPSPAA